MEQQMENGPNKASAELYNKHIAKNPLGHKIRLITITIVNGLRLTIINNIEIVGSK